MMTKLMEKIKAEISEMEPRPDFKRTEALSFILKTFLTVISCSRHGRPVKTVLLEVLLTNRTAAFKCQYYHLS